MRNNSVYTTFTMSEFSQVGVHQATNSDYTSNLRSNPWSAN